MSVLKYIQNEKRRFQIFIANRVQTIRALTDVKEWRHVLTKHNPEDIASRGIMPSEVKKVKIWLIGPQFLYESEAERPSQMEFPTVSADDPELGKETHNFSAFIQNELQPAQRFVNYYSSFVKLRRAVAWILRFQRFVQWKHQLMSDKGFFSVKEVESAEKQIITMVQRQSFPQEMANLQNHKVGDRIQFMKKAVLSNLHSRDL